ncbi:MAG: alpha/beta fold hydrolase [Thalassotalea sp.]
MSLLHFKQVGTGPDIILIHGLFGSLDNLGMVAKALAQKYRVTSVDVRNHGQSFHHTDMSYQQTSGDVIALMDHLKIETAHILGHSMGGKIAMQMAIDYPNKVNKLMIADIAPVQYPAHHEKIITGLLSLNFAELENRKSADLQLSHYVDDVGVRQFLLRNLALDDNKQLYFKCNIDNISKGYPQIMQAIATDKTFIGPTLFIKGGKSDYITAKHSDIIKQLFPNSRAKIIQGAGHWLHAEKSIAFNKIIDDFLNADF